VVELVCDLHTKQEMVLKRCNIDRPESFEIARIEINMLQKYKGPHVVELLDSGIHEKTRTSREALLLMEFCPGDHLLNRLLQRNGQYLPADAILRMFGQICLPLKDMHTSHPAIINRDLKLENVLFGQVRHTAEFTLHHSLLTCVNVCAL
jgi:serine/threonine protein kinase